MASSTSATSTILTLPAEILQSVLRQVTTPSFLQLCRSCTKFRTIARTSRKVLLHHLSHIPGVKLGLEDRPTNELFLLLQQRAAKNLFGINFHADHICYPATVDPVDATASEISPGSDPNLAVVYNNQPVVHLSHATRFGIQPRVTLVLHPPATDSFPDANLEIVKVRITCPRSDWTPPAGSAVSIRPYSVVSILYKLTPLQSWEQTPVKHLGSKSWQTTACRISGVAQFRVTEDRVEQLQIGSLPNEPDCDPFALAIDDPEAGTLAVAWRPCKLQGEDKAGGKYCSADVRIGLYRTFDQNAYSITLDATAEGIPIPQRTEGLVISDIAIARDSYGVSERILIYPPGSFTYDMLLQPVTYNFFSEFRYYVDEDEDGVKYRVTGGAKCLDNGLPVSTCNGTRLFKIGIPFFSMHRIQVSQEERTMPGLEPEICMTTFLKLGFDVKGYAHASDTAQAPRMAAIFRQVVNRDHSRCYESSDLESIQPIDDSHLFVARLWGFHVPQTNRLGVIATSSGGSRIAIGDWNKILIWALNPFELAENYEDATGYYESEKDEVIGLDSKDTIALLRPVVLKLEDGAVVRQIKFASPRDSECRQLIPPCQDCEDTLFVMTDRGMIVFNLGSSAKGIREVRDWPKPRQVIDVELSEMDL